MIDKKINEQQMDKVLQYVGEKKGANGQWQFRQNVSDADLRAALTEAKLQADAADIADEPAAFDPSDEVKKILDDAMGNAAANDGATDIEIEVPPPQPEPVK